MSNGFKDKDGAEISRNSTRHTSPNEAVKQMTEFSRVVGVWRGAAQKDGQLWKSLGHDAHIVVEETARQWYTTAPENREQELPDNWRERIDAMKPHAMAIWSARPRG